MTLQFTVEHDHTVFVDEGEEQLIGNIYFTVQTRPGDFQVRDSGAPTPRTISLPRRTAYLGPDGHLYKDETSGEPFRLVANDPAYNLDHITYRADFELTTLIGESIPVRHCYFPAPSTDTTLYLTRAMVDPEQIVMAVRAQCYAEDILDAGALGAVMVTLNTAAEIRAALGIDLIDLDEWEWLTNFAAFPVSGATGVVYGDLATGALWRWNGSAYTPATQDMALRTHLATSKTTPVDADELPLVDSEASNALKKFTWGNVKANLDTRYSPLVGRGNAVVFMGDSLTGRGCVPRTTDTGSIAIGGLVQMVLSRVPSLRYLFNAGVGGDGTPGMVLRWAADVIAYSPTVLFLEGGGNDVSNPSISETTTIANLRFMIRDAKRIGCMVFLCTIPPRSDSSLYRDNIERVNGGIRRLAAYEGAHLIDFYGALVDPATGYYAAGMSDDTVHPNSDGNRIIANLSASVMNRVLPAGGLPVAQAQYVGTPNRMPNSCMLDDTNADGVPDSWTAGGSATTSTISRVDDDDFLGKACQIQFTGAATKYITTSISISLAPVGSTIAFCGKYKADVEAGSGTYRIDLLFHNTTNTNYYHLRPVFDVDYDTDGIGYFYMEGVVPPATDRLDISVIALTGAGTLKVGQFAVWVLDEDGKPI